MREPTPDSNTSATAEPWTPPGPLPAVFLTERLEIRPFRLDEVPVLFGAINTSREGHLAPWVPWAIGGHRTQAQTAAYVVDQILSIERAGEDPASFRGIGLGLFERSTGRLLGGTGIHDVRPASWSCETGYWIRREACGQGIATEACAATISWALGAPSARDPSGSPGVPGLGFRRVRIICSAANVPSVRVIEKLGVRREMVQRLDYHVPGVGITDRYGYGVLADEWDTSAHRMRRPG